MHVDAGSAVDLITIHLMALGTMTLESGHTPGMGQLQPLQQPKDWCIR